jgi:polysaccharide biosynthesis protein PelF
MIRRPQPARQERWPAGRPGGAPRVLMITEGTYPYVIGGVSTWCDQILRRTPEIDWQLLPVTAGGRTSTPMFTLPPHVTTAPAIDLWGPDSPPRRGMGERGRADLPARLATALLGWHGDPLAVAPLLVWCRHNPAAIGASFRGRAPWRGFLDALRAISAEAAAIGPDPYLDLDEAATLYQTMYWVGRAAAAPTPPVDVLHVTAAGWAVVPALVDKAIHGTPLLLTEHGLYVREAYLAAVRSDAPPARRFVATRMARGFARAAYAAADIVAPVCAAHRAWEESLGVDPARIVPIPNGVPAPAGITPAPRTRTVVSVGRVDPLKDVHTMLRVADEVRRRMPGVTFLHYGPVSAGQDAYAESCRALHAELNLGDTLQFLGATRDPTGVMRDADLVLMTSISEAFPMAVLEAQSQGRPVVTTAVGGVLEAIEGGGLSAPPGDVSGLADAVAGLLGNPDLAETLGRRGHARVSRLYSEDACVDRYRELLFALAEDRSAAEPAA